MRSTDEWPPQWHIIGFLQKRIRTTSIFYLVFFFFLRSLDSKYAYSTSLLSYNIVYYNHCPFITANANGSNIYHSKKTHFFFFLLNRNLYFGSWCATRLKQQNYKTVYLTQYVEEICICFIVFVLMIMPC